MSFIETDGYDFAVTRGKQTRIIGVAEVENSHISGSSTDVSNFLENDDYLFMQLLGKNDEFRILVRQAISSNIVKLNVIRKLPNGKEECLGKGYSWHHLPPNNQKFYFQQLKIFGKEVRIMIFSGVTKQEFEQYLHSTLDIPPLY